MRAVWLARRGGWLALLLAVGCSSGSGAGPSVAPAPTAGADPNAPAGSAPAAPANDGNWEKIREENGITVLREEVEGSPLVAFRGIGDIDAPIAKVALILMDVDHNKEWIDRMVEARALKHYSDTEHLTYSHIGAPPLVSDRDFVNKNTITFTPPDRILISIQSVEDPLGPVTNHVRGQLLHSSFSLQALGPERTHVVCEIHADPKGSLPKFAVNYFQKNWAFVTITKMREQVKKAGIVERAPDVRDLLGRQGFPVQ